MAGILHKLWDETLAGPPPDSGLGKLRKYNSLSATTAVAAPPELLSPRHDDSQPLPISRSNTVLRGNAHRNLSLSIDPPSAPPSPSGSSTPISPFSPTTPGGNIKKLRRRKSSSVTESKSPTGYDWIVLSSLDR